MKTAYCCVLLLGLCCVRSSLPALAGEPQAGEAAQMKGKMSAHMRALGNADGEALHRQSEMSLVKEGLLGTVNVLRELEVTTGKNLVTVKSNVNPDIGTHESQGASQGKTEKQP